MATIDRDDPILAGAVDLKPLDERHQIVPDADDRVADHRSLDECRASVRGMTHVCQQDSDVTAPDAPKGVRGRNSDNTAIPERLGREPSTPLATGLERTYAWIHDDLARTVGAGRAIAATG